MKRISASFFILSALISTLAHSYVYEISGSPFATDGAPLPQHMQNISEKLILVDPSKHVWGAYNENGKLIRWGIATAGANQCRDSDANCRTQVGSFRIYSLGGPGCTSKKFDDAPMPYCMYFNGGQALHGSQAVAFNNVSHGCVRIHTDDAQWLRYHFVEAPKATNNFRGTQVIIRNYAD
jgi:hypothetical protein